MLEIPTTLIELKNISIGNYDFAIVEIGKKYYIEFEDLLFATLIDDALATQILSLMDPPNGYFSLIQFKELYENVSEDGDDHTYLLETPFIESHGAIALIRLAIQERPSNKHLLAIEEYLKEVFEFEAGDEEIVKYILQNPWLEKIKKR